MSRGDVVSEQCPAPSTRRASRSLRWTPANESRTYWSTPKGDVPIRPMRRAISSSSIARAWSKQTGSGRGPPHGCTTRAPAHSRPSSAKRPKVSSLRRSSSRAILALESPSGSNPLRKLRKTVFGYGSWRTSSDNEKTGDASPNRRSASSAERNERGDVKFRPTSAIRVPCNQISNVSIMTAPRVTA